LGQIVINSQFAFQESLSFGMLLANGVVSRGETGCVCPFRSKRQLSWWFPAHRAAVVRWKAHSEDIHRGHGVLPPDRNSAFSGDRSRREIVSIFGEMHALPAIGQDAAIGTMCISNIPMGKLAWPEGRPWTKAMHNQSKFGFAFRAVSKDKMVLPDRGELSTSALTNLANQNSGYAVFDLYYR
jgi:hypothetical protein